jgi:hypothetical protein
MKETAANMHTTGERGPEQEATAERTSLLALSRRGRRASERKHRESDAETAEFDAMADEGDETAEFDSTASETAAADAAAADSTAVDSTAVDSTAVDSTAVDSTATEAADRGGKRRRFKHWRRQRPFIGGVLMGLGGIELFFSGQLDMGNLQIQFGIEGLQATIIPIALLALGISVIFRPTHHIFYGIIALVLAVYSLIGVNLGGFLLGMLLSTIGAILVVAWMGPRDPESDASHARAPAAERRGESKPAGEEGTA